VLFVFLCSVVFAVSGVMPGSYEVDFEPGYSGEFVFDFVLNGEAELYIEGDLAGYVELDKRRISGRESVVAVLNLPSEIESVGINQIFVGARGDGVDVRGAIKIVVPYPERYVGLELSAPNVNSGEVVEISLRMLNLGRQVVDVSPRVEVYRMVDGELSMVDGEAVGVFYGEGGVLGVSEFLDFNVSFDSSNYFAGDYVAVALVDYGEVFPLDSFRHQTGLARVENVFRLGEFKIRILNYSDEFVEGEIGKFEIEIENLWDSRMLEVYAEVVVESGVGFDSSIVGLKGWEKKTLVGAFDGFGFVDGFVDAKIIVHYDGGVVSEDVRLRIVGDVSYVFYYYVVGGLVLVGVLVWFVFRKGGVNK